MEFSCAIFEGTRIFDRKKKKEFGTTIVCVMIYLSRSKVFVSCVTKAYTECIRLPLTSQLKHEKIIERMRDFFKSRVSKFFSCILYRIMMIIQKGEFHSLCSTFSLHFYYNIRHVEAIVCNRKFHRDIISMFYKFSVKYY